MIARRTLINLGVFFALTFLLIGYGYFTLIQNPLNRPMVLYSYINDTGGVRPGFTVALRGVPVGHVSEVSLAHVRQADGTSADKIRLGLAIEPGVTVPADAHVQVERANPLGEQQVELIPSVGTAVSPAKGGAVLLATSTPTPPDVGQVVDAADRILGAVPTDQLATIIRELAAAFRGRAQDIRTIIEASSVYAKETLAYQDQFKALLANSPPVLDTVASVGPQLRDALDNTKALADLLDKRSHDLVNLFHTSTTFSQLGSQLIDQNGPNLACLTHDLADLGANLSTQPNYKNLDSALLINQSFFEPVNNITPAGTSKSLDKSVPAHPQTWLRVRTLLPPQMPSAITYTTPNRIPDTYPGAACVSVLGNGVPAGAQANAAKPIEVGKVIPAPAQTGPIEQSTGPTPAGGGSGPGNVFGGATPAGAAAASTPASVASPPASAASTPPPVASTPAPPSVPHHRPSGHPETIVFVTSGILGLGLLERREVARVRRARRKRR